MRRDDNEAVFEGGLQRRRGGFFRMDSEGKLVITPTRPRPQTPWPRAENQENNEATNGLEINSLRLQ